MWGSAGLQHVRGSLPATQAKRGLLHLERTRGSSVISTMAARNQPT